MTTDKPAKQELLEDALEIVTGPRQQLYGKPSQNFIDTANLLNAYLSPKIAQLLGTDDEYAIVAAHDVAVLQLLLKVARIINSPLHKDNWIDIAGYAACGWEAAIEAELTDANPEAWEDNGCEAAVSNDLDGKYWRPCLLKADHAGDHVYQPRCEHIRQGLKCVLAFGHDGKHDFDTIR